MSPLQVSEPTGHEPSEVHQIGNVAKNSILQKFQGGNQRTDLQKFLIPSQDRPLGALLGVGHLVRELVWSSGWMSK